MSKRISRLSSVQKLFITYGFCGIAASLAHPITPNLINNLNMPSYMFGVAFASMSLTNFLISPFWGNINNFFSPRKILALAMIGYSLGQGIFGLGSSQLTIVLGRMIAGIFISAMNVSAVYYTMKMSSKEDMSKNITKTITIFSVCGTIGYLIGGVIGSINIQYTVVLQCVLLLISGILFYTYLDEVELSKVECLKSIVKDSNPIQSFFKVKDFINIKILLLFISMFFVSFASTSLTQNFQYYLQTELALSSSIGGLTRSIVGLLSILANFYITIKIVNGRKVEKAITIVLSTLIINIVVLYFFKDVSLMFSMIGVIALVIDTIQVSLYQDRNANYADEDNRGVMIGMHNSIKSLGMIGGSLISSIVYGFSPFMPFIMALILYLFALVFNIINERRLKYE